MSAGFKPSPVVASPLPSPAMRFAPFAFLLLWSSGFAVLKWGLRDAEPMTFLSLRYAAVVALLLPAALVIHPAWPRGRAWLHLIVVGVMVQGLYFGGDFLSLGGAPAGTVALISALQPILIGLLAPWLAQERVSARRWLGLLLGLTGATVVILARTNAGAATPWALFWATVALFGMTGGTLYERRFGGGQHLVVANLVQCATGLVIVLPFALAFETMHVHLTPRFAMSLGYLVIANSLVSISLLLAMLRAGSASAVSAWFFLIPPVSGIVAWLLLGEVMAPAGWAGMAIAAAGVALATREG